MPDRRILRPVTLTPSEAALAYVLVASVDTPRGRARDAASLLDKCEAAMEAEAPTVEETEQAFSDTGEARDD